MRVAASRADVHPSDLDGLRREFVFRDGMSLTQIVGDIAASGWLPQISGGRAAWSVASNMILAVVAQEWREPKMTSAAALGVDRLDRRGGVLHLHFNYHAQIDPETVYRILWGLQLRHD